MSILAEMALKRARGRLNSVQSRANSNPPAKAANPAPASAVHVPVPTGPINHLMFLEGRSWALDMVACLRQANVEVVVERLAGATTGRPGSYAAGIQSVIKELQEFAL